MSIFRFYNVCRSAVPLHQIRLNMETNRSICTSAFPALFWSTPCLLAEPMKKKKRIDPAVIKQREERRKRKIEKQIRRLEKHAKQLKPIDELEIPLVLVEERKVRRRWLDPLTNEEIEGRALIEKEWAKVKLQNHLNDVKMLDRIMYSQQRALDELKLESEELYNAAVELDMTLLQFTFKGPVSNPPIEDYTSPDGEYTDTSKKWV